MRIATVQQRTGVSRRLLRYYEEQGLLRPQRSANGYREYTEADVAAVGHIRTLLSAGIGTATIGELLPCMAEASMCPELATNLTRERTKISAEISRLQESQLALDTLVTKVKRKFETDQRAG